MTAPVRSGLRGVRVVFIGALMVCLLGMLGLSALPWWLSRSRAIPTVTATTVPTLAGAPFISTQPIVPRASHRPGTGQSLVGAVFATGEDSQVLALRGLPITFVAPHAWGCVTSSTGVAGSEAWRCVDEHAGNDRPQIDIVVRQCPSACTDAQRTELVGALSHPVSTFEVHDPRARYAERTAGGQYLLTLDLIFATDSGGPADWQLVLEADARPADVPTVQKVANDIWNQVR